MDESDALRFDTAVIAADGLNDAGRRIAEGAGFLFGREQFDVVAHRPLIALLRQDAIGFLVDDFLRDVALA